MVEFWQNLLREFQTPFQDSVLVFAVILFIILLAPILLRRLRIPGIIGLIISGVIIGPHGLFLIERSSAVDLFSTIGLLYIMFIAGLELDLGDFKKHRYKSAGFGFLTFLFPILLGFPVCYYLLGYGFNTSLLTASMFATHTLIAYPIVSRLGITRNEAVAVTVGGTILTDTAVLIILAAISGMESGNGTKELWARLGISILIFLLIVAFIIPRIAAWFFKRLEDEKNAHFIFVLSVVFFCAFLAELSGLEPIIGAFAAGLLLNPLIPNTSPLMNRIEFVGSSLFIPFFLISVGMLIDVRVLAQGPQALIVAAALTIVALTGKWIAARATGLLFRYSKAQSQLIFGLSSAHAAATLAVILVGYNLGIIDDNILNGTIVLILVTCLVASFVTEEAGKQVVLETDDEAPAEMQDNPQRILVPISNPVTMERLIDFAITLKEPRNAFPIVALTVVPDDEKARAKLLQARKMLEKAITHAAAADQKIDITTTIDQNVTAGIQRVVRETFITDIIMGWPGKTNLADIIFGKTFDSVVNQTSQNVFITRFTLPLNVHKRIHILCPHFAEKESGFYAWVDRMLRVSARLNLRTMLYASEDTFRAVSEYAAKNKINVEVESRASYDISDLIRLRANITSDDIVALICARKGSISYTPLLDVLPRKMVRQMSDNSLIFVYPEIQTDDFLLSYTQEPAGGFLEKGMDILRSARNIFKK
ncbi:MAG TPA: cation:proton antiporter [Cyclobacteriaceae bacterium]|nr:cation:proton antiporter [Cyclobacteriaceae bacterium]